MKYEVYADMLSELRDDRLAFSFGARIMSAAFVGSMIFPLLFG